MKILIATLFGLAVWLFIRPSSRHRLRSVVHPRTKTTVTALPLALIASIALGCGIAVILGSIPGVVLGVLAGLGAHRGIGRLESRATRDRKSALM